jgi:hypothetical protein
VLAALALYFARPSAATFLAVVVGGAELVAVRLSMSETSSTSLADDHRLRLATFSEPL